MMEIIGTGYGKEIEIGESYLHENVISMWDFAPKGAFTYHVGGITYTLNRITKESKTGYTFKSLTKEEMTPEIIKCLEEKRGIKLAVSE